MWWLHCCISHSAVIVFLLWRHHWLYPQTVSPTKPSPLKWLIIRSLVTAKRKVAIQLPHKKNGAVWCVYCQLRSTHTGVLVSQHLVVISKSPSWESLLWTCSLHCCYWWCPSPPPPGGRISILYASHEVLSSKLNSLERHSEISHVWECKLRHRYTAQLSTQVGIVCTISNDGSLCLCLCMDI